MDKTNKWVLAAIVLLGVGIGYLITNQKPVPPSAPVPVVTTSPVAATTSEVASTTPSKGIDVASVKDKPQVYEKQTISGTALTTSNVLAAVNNERIAVGKVPLKENAKLDAAANAQLADMESKSYFNHISPTGKLPWNWVEDAGYGYYKTGENLANNFSTVQEMVAAWVISPAHHANIVGAYTETGIAMDTVDEYTTTENGTEVTHRNLVIQVFGFPN